MNTKTSSVFRAFSPEENEVWQILCKKRFQSLKGIASSLHIRGWEALGMSMQLIPNFSILNTKLKTCSGWQVGSTGIQYEEDTRWLSSLASRTLLITEYIRGKDSLDYTPLPDIFHDAFGHIPFLAILEYARIAEAFGCAYAAARTPEEKLIVANNWWYTIEFGFIRENGELKAFGAGLISSEGELANALSPNVKKLPYNWDVVGKMERSAHEYHTTLFVLESLEELEQTVRKVC